MAALDRFGPPLAVSTNAAIYTVVTLVQISVDSRCMIEPMPGSLIGGRAYDRDRLVDTMCNKGAELIAPHGSNQKGRRQDSRQLRRAECRWIGKYFIA